MPLLSEWQTVLFSWILSFFALGNATLGDVVLYNLPNGKKILIEGKVRKSGRSINLTTHVGTITISLENCSYITSPTRREKFSNLVRQANQEQNVEAYLVAARFGLQSGFLKETYKCFSEAWKIDPKDETLLRLINAHKSIRKEVETSESEDEKRFREIIDRRDMQVICSEHFVLMHDITSGSVASRNRPQKRLELLEQVYATFFLKFALEGYPLETPKERLMVMLFGDHEDYIRYVNLLDPQLQNASGFWSPINNVAVFYDQSTTPSLKLLQEINQELEQAKKVVRRTGSNTESRDYHQFANTIGLLTKLLEEEADFEVVSHEAIHQLAGNSGLMPREMIFLRWAQEGLAAYFETTSGSGWSGVGAVNSQRLAAYNALKNDREHSNVEFIVTDKVFDYAGNLQSQLLAYGQAWAVTHFLMEQCFDDYMSFLKLVREIDPESTITQKQESVLKAFQTACLKTPDWDRKWRIHMSGLKTDLDEALRSTR